MDWQAEAHVGLVCSDLHCVQAWASDLGQDFVINTNIKDIDFATVHAWPDNWMLPQVSRSLVTHSGMAASASAGQECEQCHLSIMQAQQG
jgi:hypothetical protein